MKNMEDQDYRNMLIECLGGKPVGGSTEYAVRMEKSGLAKFTGDQHNENWVWIKEKISKLSTEELEEIFANAEI